MRISHVIVMSLLALSACLQKGKLEMNGYVDLVPGVLVPSSSSSINFGDVIVNQQSTQTIRLANTGGSTVTLGNREDFSTFMADPFSIHESSTCDSGYKINLQAQCDLIIEYSPQSTGTHSGILTITYHDGWTAQRRQITLSGRGILPNTSITSVAFITGDGSYGAGAVIDVRATFSEVVTVNTGGGTPRWQFAVGGPTRYASYVSGSGTNTLTFRYAVVAGDNSNDLDYLATNSLELTGGTIRDAGSNNADLTLPAVGTLASLHAIVVDTAAPTITSVAFLTGDGSYGAGALIDVRATFSEVVAVNTGGGTPRWQLAVGGPTRYASYVSGSGTNTLTFRYTVFDWDVSVDLDYSASNALGLDGGTIRDIVGNDANLTLPAVGTLATLHQVVINTCPDGYVQVSPNPAVGTTSEFCVMKYEAKNVAGVATSQTAFTPWAFINQISAKAACAALGASYDLISNPEWMTIAYDIEGFAVNWDSGIVGTGALFRGHTDNTPGNSLAVTNPADPYDSTGNNSGEAMGAGKEQKRSFLLSNGEVIWDFAGNIWEWVDWTLGGALASGPTTCAGAWTDFPLVGCGDLAAADYMPDNPAGVAPASYNAAYGLGRFYGGAGGAALRGGGWNAQNVGGTFSLTLAVDSSNIDGNRAFRCVFRRCPDGYIAVPPNPTVGTTTEFCVMKYEAKALKNDTGVVDADGCAEAACTTANWASIYHPTNNPTGYRPVSTTEGLPWRQINATNAKKACANLGYNFDLISNPEWMTIARNIEMQDANWSNGSVGDGCLFSGNYGINDSCGYDGPNPESGPGRDTKAKHRLSNGEEIWDIAGNILEWVDWTPGGPFTPVMNTQKAYIAADAGPVALYRDFADLDTNINIGAPMEPITWQATDPTLTRTQGIGGYFAGTGGGGGAALRSGGWSYGTNGGAFALLVNNTATFTTSAIGLRCVYRRCPDGYALVPPNPAVGTTSEFCVMKFEARALKNDTDVIDMDGCGEGGCTTANWAGIYHPTTNTTGYRPSIPAASTSPWRRISASDAKTACTNLGMGFDLISNAEWMTIARNLETQSANWSGGNVGDGCLFRGNNGIDDSCGYDGPDPEADTGNEPKAKHRLSNGEEVWDIAANVWEWVDWTLGGTFDSGPTTCSAGWAEFPSVSCGDLTAADYMPGNPAVIPVGNYDAIYGLGRFYGGVGGGAVRGGPWTDGAYAGAFALMLSYAPTDTSMYVGFRCVFRP